MAPVIAPVSEGDRIGTLHVYFRDKPVADFELVAMHDVGMGSFLSRFVDSVRLRIKPSQNNEMHHIPQKLEKSHNKSALQASDE